MFKPYVIKIKVDWLTCELIGVNDRDKINRYDLARHKLNTLLQLPDFEIPVE